MIEFLYNNVTDRLGKKLPKHITYQHVEHTQSVFEKAGYIAIKDGVSKKNLFLVIVAALYHNVGLIKTHIEHEKKGCRIELKELPENGFSEKDIEEI